MDVKRQDYRVKFQRFSGSGIYVLTLLLWPLIMPLAAYGQLTEQSGGNSGPTPNQTRQWEIRDSALGHLRNGNPDQALKVLEVAADWALPISLIEDDLLVPAVAGLNRALMQLGSEEQFDLLSKWSMPTDAPPKIRLLTALVPTIAPPSEFARILGERPRATSFPVSSIGEVRGIFCTGWALVSAARESGRLKRLMTDLRPHVEKKIPNADLLFTLAQIADGAADKTGVTELLSRRTQQIQIALQEARPAASTIDPADLVLATAASNVPSLRPLSRNLIEALLASTAGPPAGHVRPFLQRARTSIILLDLGATVGERVANCRLKYWIPVSGDIGSRTDWHLIDDHIAHLSGSGNDVLLLRYPLQGEFTFHVDALSGGQVAGDGGLIYGGLQFQARTENAMFSIRDVNGAQLATRSCPFVQKSSGLGFNRLSIAASPSGTTMAVNLHPMWTEKAAIQNSPWLGLSSMDRNRTVFRNLRFTGHPTIPQAVRMTDGNLLRGWLSCSNGWRLTDGVIHAPMGRADQPADDHEHLLSFQRPVFSGESVSYEFFYQPGISEVSPAVGRLAFLLQPDGVRAHWVVDGKYEWTGLPADNVLSEPLNRRGQRPLPFELNAWNRITLAVTDQAVTLSLNNMVVYLHPIDGSTDRRFGLYHHRTATSAQVRNVVMAGNWPETLPDDFLDNPMVTIDEQLTGNDRHVINQLVPEEFSVSNVLAIRRRALAMPVKDRFEFLSRWILPGPDRSGLRVSGDFTQTRPSPLAIEPGVRDPDLGGQIVSPIFDWLDAAQELGSLAECRQRVEAVAASDDEFQQRAKAALLLLISLEQSEPVGTDAAWESLFGLLKKDVYLGEQNHWPEMLVAVRGGEKFNDSAMCDDLIRDLVLGRMLKWRQPDVVRWHNHLASLHGKILLRRNEAAIARPSSTELREWIPVAAGKAFTFGSGHPNLNWIRRDNKVIKVSCHHADYLFYRLPLSGDFQVECGLVLPGQDPVAVMVAGSYAGPLGAFNGLDNGIFRDAAAPILFQPALTNVGKPIHYRAVIYKGTRTIYLSGQKVLETQLPETFDPWIAIRSPGRHLSSVVDFRITGQPKVLDVVPMSLANDLTGWMSYHDESRWEHLEKSETGSGSKQIGCIIGHQNPELAGTYSEGLLRYERPLVEDGSIEYEFFYQPGVAEVHPALDRLSFVLHPSGVREHWITDGRHDRSRLAPDNMTDVALNRRGPAELPFIAGQWNRVRLSLIGATVRIELNKTLVYERVLEATNQRAFGLFHYVDRSRAEVRNVEMRGDWSRMLPNVSQQQLADVTGEELDQAFPRLKSVFKYDFAKEGLSGRYFEFPSPSTIAATPEGVWVTQSVTNSPIVWDICARFAISGDFDVEAAFANLQVENRKQHCGIMVRAAMNEPQVPVFDLHRNVDHLNQRILQVSRWFSEPSVRGRHLARSDSIACEASGGRFRLARRGEKLHYLFAENDSSNYQMLGTEEISRSDTLHNGIRLECYDFGGDIKLVWKSLILRAERMTWHPGPNNSDIALLKVIQADGSGLKTVVVPSSAGYRYVGSPEWSPDGRKIAVDMSDGNSSVAHIVIVNSDGTGLKDLGTGCMPSFSEDGSRIAFSQPGRGIMTMKSDGTDRQVVDGSGWGTQWSPDGKWIAYGKGGNITLLDVKTRQKRQLLAGDAATRYGSIYWNLGWSHDSQGIAFKARRQRANQDEIGFAPINSPEEFKVIQQDATGTHPDVSFSPDNENIVVSIDKGGRQGNVLHTISRSQPAMPRQMKFVPAGLSVDGAAWSRDGKSIALVVLESSQPTEWTTEMKSDSSSR